MAVDPKVTARSAAKKASKAKNPKMPTASAKDLKAIEVAGVSEDLKHKLFGVFAYQGEDAYNMYMGFRKKGMNPSKAYEKLYNMSMDEVRENMNY
tara:strand:- start:8 stop:292 length:285 start_codon:yes stop_codon:yes gene_type:complete